MLEFECHLQSSNVLMLHGLCVPHYKEDKLIGSNGCFRKRGGGGEGGEGNSLSVRRKE